MPIEDPPGRTAYSLLPSSFNNPENVILGHDQEILVVDLDFRACVGREEHAVAFLDGEGHVLAGLLVQESVAERDDLAFLGLVLGGLGQEDAGIGLVLGLGALHENLVSKRLDVHRVCSPNRG